MCITPNENEAMCYEALTLLSSGDRKRAWDIVEKYSIIGKDALPSYSKEIIEELGVAEDDITKTWQYVRDSFSRERISFSAISIKDELFPENRGDEAIHYLYAAGNKELLKGRIITFLGMSIPSLQGKSDIVDAVTSAVKEGYTVMAPFDTGLGAFALSVALKENGKAIGFLPGQLSKCPAEGLLELQGEIYNRGLLLSIFSPAEKVQKWHVVYRNRFLSGISKAVFLAEDKDGGPSWAIFDPVLERGALAMISSSAASNPNYRWAADRVSKGAMEYKKPSDIKKLIPRVARAKKERFEDLTPDLFDGLL